MQKLSETTIKIEELKKTVNHILEKEPKLYILSNLITENEKDREFFKEILENCSDYKIFNEKEMV